MNSATPSYSQTGDSLSRAVEALRVFCGMVLLSFAKHGQGPRDTIIRGFLARGMACTESILLVWRAGSEQDAWILHRTLIDRLLHLHHLAKHDQFCEFEEFSFLYAFEAQEKMLADNEMREKVPRSLKSTHEAYRLRYRQLSTRGSSWRRPKAAEVAKDMGLGFLYRYGYDYASAHIHPMASDGEADFARLVSPSSPQSPLDTTVIRNSILVNTMLVQEGLNASSMHWRAIVYEFLEQVRRFTGDDSMEFEPTLYRLATAWPAFELCQPTGDPTNDSGETT